MFTFADLQAETKRRATRDQGGTQFDTAIKNIINTSLFRIARESLWRPLRRKTVFSTVTSYTTGSGAGSFTNASANLSITGATLITDNIKIGRRIKMSGDGTFHTIKEINAEDALTIEEGYNGTATNVGTYSILGQEEYNLPIQVSQRMFMWHEEYGYPYQMTFLTDQEFYSRAWDNTSEAIPTFYRMWEENMVISQPLQPSILRVNSSDNGDTAIDVTIFGTVASYPDFETIATDASNGTAYNAGSKTFSNIDRVVKAMPTDGRISLFSDDTNNNVAVMPVGDTTAGILYKKIQLYPLPNTVFEMHVQFYKDPLRLVGDGDVHELGQQFDEAIILLSVAKIKAEQSQKEAANWFAMYSDEIRSLRRTNLDKIDWFPSLQRPSLSGGDALVHSNLSYRQVGAFFGRSSRS